MRGWPRDIFMSRVCVPLKNGTGQAHRLVVDDPSIDAKEAVWVIRSHRPEWSYTVKSACISLAVSADQHLWGQGQWKSAGCYRGILEDLPARGVKLPWLKRYPFQVITTVSAKVFFKGVRRRCSGRFLANLDILRLTTQGSTRLQHHYRAVCAVSASSSRYHRFRPCGVMPHSGNRTPEFPATRKR